MVFDALDGRVARMARMTSRFGMELDSLCDVISFGVAPAVIVKAIADQQGYYTRLAWVTSAVFMLCAALRLARFNAITDEDESSHQAFQGLPSPAAGGFIAALAVLYYSLRSDGSEFGRLANYLEPIMDGLLYGVPFVAVVLALLMISNVPYPHMFNRLLQGYGPFEQLVTVMLIALFAFLTKPFSLPLLFGIYVCSGIVLRLKHSVMKRAERYEWPWQA